jgi:DNA modification methylase
MTNAIDLGVDKSHDLNSVAESNEEAFARLIRLYAREGQTIADVTFGRGVFWKHVSQMLYDVKASDLMDGIDFRALPYTEASIDVVVLDPPYRYTPAKNQAHVADAQYQLQASAPTRTQGVVELYLDGMREANRVLKQGGFLFVKCQDTVQDGKQIWTHVDLINAADGLGYAVRDLLVVTNDTAPATRWSFQRHLRKHHSYFLVLRKGGHFPFGLPSVEKR